MGVFGEVVVDTLTTESGGNFTGGEVRLEWARSFPAKRHMGPVNGGNTHLGLEEDVLWGAVLEVVRLAVALVIPMVRDEVQQDHNVGQEDDIVKDGDVFEVSAVGEDEVQDKGGCEAQEGQENQEHPEDDVDPVY